jgi:hypothetical protein
LFAAELDRPLDYLSESDRWDEVSGAAQRLANATDKLQAILARTAMAPTIFCTWTPGASWRSCMTGQSPNVGPRLQQRLSRAKPIS